MRRQHQPLFQGRFGFGFKQLIHLAQPVHVGKVKVILAVLVLAAQVHIAVGAVNRPADIFEMAHALHRHGDALEAVGDLHRIGVQRHAAGLLEVGELGDFLPVQPHFPAQTPGAQRRRFPVILDEANVVLARIDAQRLERLEVDLLRVAGIRLEDDLELGVHLQPIGVFAKAAVIRAHRRFHVGHVPGFRAQHAQVGGRVHGARAHLGVIGLPDQAALVRPETLQRQDDRLKIERLVHAGLTPIHPVQAGLRPEPCNRRTA